MICKIQNISNRSLSTSKKKVQLDERNTIVIRRY